MDTRIAALVILYNYEEGCIQNMISYLDTVDILYAFDNSTKKNGELENKLKEMDKVCFIDGKGNRGLSKAINVVARMAIKQGYRWLITFDQDSVAHQNMISQMKDFISSYQEIDTIGMIGPTIKTSLLKFKEVSNSISFNEWVIQSGALHNLVAYQKLTGYDENLFIDQVDIEYCIRLRENGYKIVKINHAVLLHNTLDDKVTLIKKKDRNLFANKYSPIRYYYFIRNNLYCAKKYKKKNPQYHAQLKRNILSLLQTIPYEKDILARLRAVWYGYWDYKLERFGKTNREF